MSLFRRVKIRSYEVGLRFHEGEFVGLLDEGTHWIFNPFQRQTVEVVSLRAPQLSHEKIDVIVKSGALEGRAIIVDLKDTERAIIWYDGRFSGILTPGLYAFWSTSRQVRVELIDARTPRFENNAFNVIAKWSSVHTYLDIVTVNRGCVGALFIEGEYTAALEPGRYAFWRGVVDARVVEVDLRELTLDVSGQELMTSDKVTLRINAVVTYKVIDPKRAVCAAEDAKQALYREAQLALRGVVGLRELDAFLAEKDDVARETEEMLRVRAADLGLQVLATGIRDVILPGDMKDLMNKVTEARKAAEANLVFRREETAAMRSQANTAKLLNDNPVLMRLRELEALEKIAAAGKLNVVLGERGLTDRVINLL